jgi:L-iditol 2-dehydrogenase
LIDNGSVRVAELIATHRFHLTEAPARDPGPGEVQVRVAAVGICGSDMHYFSEGSIGDIPCQYPMVLGHEPSGSVVKTGSGVTGWSKGDRAALEPAIYCYHCEFCLSGHHNVCSNIRFLSMPEDPGFFREFINLPVESLLPLPPGMSFEAGTLFEPLAVVVHSMKFAALQPGETAVVFGAGPIGLMTISVLRLSGARRIWSVEPVPERRALALQMGADAVLEPEGAAAQILADTGRRGVDVAIDCAAKGDSLDGCIAATRNAGRVVVTGIPSGARVSIDFHTMRRKELALLNVRRSNHESETALDLLAEHARLFAPMLTHDLPLESVARGFDLLDQYEDNVGKVTIRLFR